MVIKDKVLDPYVIECKDNNYTIKKETGTEKDGSPKYKAEGYFTTKEAVVNKLVKLKCECKDVEVNLRTYFLIADREHELIKDVIG